MSDTSTGGIAALRIRHLERELYKANARLAEVPASPEPVAWQSRDRLAEADGWTTWRHLWDNPSEPRKANPSLREYRPLYAEPTPDSEAEISTTEMHLLAQSDMARMEAEGEMMAEIRALREALETQRLAFVDIYEYAGEKLWKSRQRSDSAGHVCDYQRALQATKQKAKKFIARQEGDTNA